MNEQPLIYDLVKQSRWSKKKGITTEPGAIFDCTSAATALFSDLSGSYKELAQNHNLQAKTLLDWIWDTNSAPMKHVPDKSLLFFEAYMGDFWANEKQLERELASFAPYWGIGVFLLTYLPSDVGATDLPAGTQRLATFDVFRFDEAKVIEAFMGFTLAIDADDNVILDENKMPVFVNGRLDSTGRKEAESFASWLKSVPEFKKANRKTRQQEADSAMASIALTNAAMVVFTLSFLDNEALVLMKHQDTKRLALVPVDDIVESPIEAMFFKTADIEGLTPQYHIGSYRVDFAIPDRHVVIELDGHDYHKTKEQRTHDAKRQRYLERNGWRVIRFTGSEVYRDPESCVQEVIEYLNVLDEPQTAGGVS